MNINSWLDTFKPLEGERNKPESGADVHCSMCAYNYYYDVRGSYVIGVRCVCKNEACSACALIKLNSRQKQTARVQSVENGDER
jgi:hypothetical protein